MLKTERKSKENGRVPRRLWLNHFQGFMIGQLALTNVFFIFNCFVVVWKNDWVKLKLFLLLTVILVVTYSCSCNKCSDYITGD